MVTTILFEGYQSWPGESALPSRVAVGPDDLLDGRQREHEAHETVHPCDVGRILRGAHVLVWHGEGFEML